MGHRTLVALSADCDLGPTIATINKLFNMEVYGKIADFRGQ